ncbi:hypothetical protein BDR06DRAFT_990596 [Suillus hirtellus]|nr:hypothetical protein BDR06DRAFT_990596 [Suillus hirtellus]
MSQFLGAAPLSVEVSSFRAPFDATDADLIIHTSDDAKFAVHKIFLAVASPLLKRFLLSGSSSPCPPFEGLVLKCDGDHAIIKLEEDAQTTERVLQYCYPFSNPVFSNLNDVQAVLEMMRKFGMKGLMNRVKGSLVQQAFLDEQPLRVFAIAYRYGLEDEARIAAKYTVRQPFFTPYVEELEHIPASVYHRLLQYHRKCSVAACSLTADFSWFPGFASRWVWFQCDDCVHHPLSWPLSDGKIYEVNAWFIEFMERARNALRERPCSKVVTDPFLIAECLEASSGCLTCRPAAFLDLSVFIGEHFTLEIEKAIDTVELDIPF